MTDLEELRITLIQTGFNIDRIFSSERIDKKNAVSVLQNRNIIALEQLNNLLKPAVIGQSKLLMDFSKFSCTEEYWEENGKIEAQEQIGAYLKYINCL